MSLYRYIIMMDADNTLRIGSILQGFTGEVGDLVRFVYFLQNYSFNFDEYVFWFRKLGRVKGVRVQELDSFNWIYHGSGFIPLCYILAWELIGV